MPEGEALVPRLGSTPKPSCATRLLEIDETSAFQSMTRSQGNKLFLDSMFRYRGLPETIDSDRDPCFTG
ncbi:LOW QUALITY PROTEIN: Pol protein [Phytophthora palmivora]|uniref:Pol protein n=1 Tax=Phytophthora palmivora TaxID=4796 RepID=A0A2P4YGA1_9STRA|nr:LOW QUALITY PROTEIN: Pol protein [Phytophthora palmivora]